MDRPFPIYRVQATTKMFPQPDDWRTVLETEDRDEARAATGTFEERAYPNAIRWQRLFEGDRIILIRKPVKPRIICAGRDDQGVARWWISYVDKDGIGGSSSASGPLVKVHAEIMRGHHWYIDRHGLART
ncbi:MULTISPECIES: hypothetical protein [Streptomyces]|uniref:Uncharacterized protein n=1 Tax=Streptomyces mordarskii TaxID=1226758 RepID=A0ABN1DXM9_9ACTN